MISQLPKFGHIRSESLHRAVRQRALDWPATAWSLFIFGLFDPLWEPVGRAKKLDRGRERAARVLDTSLIAAGGRETLVLNGHEAVEVDG